MTIFSLFLTIISVMWLLYFTAVLIYARFDQNLALHIELFGFSKIVWIMTPASIGWLLAQVVYHFVLR